jgi:hypothetical protein
VIVSVRSELPAVILKGEIDAITAAPAGGDFTKKVAAFVAERGTSSCPTHVSTNT